MRVPAYVTEVGSRPTDCLVERQLLEHGSVAAIAFSSTAEVRPYFEAQNVVHMLLDEYFLQAQKYWPSWTTTRSS